MDKVLVDRELLERAMYAKDGKELIAANRELRAILAQPAEAEGAEVKEGASGFQIARYSKRLVEQLRSDLSAVTAERDAERDQAREWLEEHYELQAEVEALRPDALIGTDAYRATVYVLRRAACDEVFGVAKLQRIFLLDWQSAERLLKEMVRRGDVEQCASHGWKFPDAAMAAKEA